MLLSSSSVAKPLHFSTELKHFERKGCPFVEVKRRNLGSRVLYFDEPSMHVVGPSGKILELRFTVARPPITIEEMDAIRPRNVTTHVIDVSQYFVLGSPGLYRAVVNGIYVDPKTGEAIKGSDKKITFRYRGTCKVAHQ